MDMTSREPNRHLRALDRKDLDDVAALLGRGMADNPIHVAVYGGSEDHLARCHARLMRTLLATSTSLRIDGVFQAHTLVGVAASAPPGRCQPEPAARLRLLGTASTFGVRAASRLLVWSRGWARHDPAEQHVHLGPVSVDRHLRGHGIGGLLLARHVESLDAEGAVGYLETDRPEAVGFYQRFGYVIVEQAEILGVRNWFMQRPPA
jgi:ribosomal protein S18 acetylase RimI-like enzyme